MNYDDARERIRRDTGESAGFHYTRANDGRLWAIGECANHEPHPPSAPPASDPDDLPYDDGPEEPWCWGPGSPEHETNQCLHNGRDE